MNHFYFFGLFVSMPLCTLSVIPVCHSHEFVRKLTAHTGCRPLVIVNLELAMAEGDGEPVEAVTVEWG